MERIDTHEIDLCIWLIIIWNEKYEPKKKTENKNNHQLSLTAHTQNTHYLIPYKDTDSSLLPATCEWQCVCTHYVYALITRFLLLTTNVDFSSSLALSLSLSICCTTPIIRRSVYIVRVQSVSVRAYQCVYQVLCLPAFLCMNYQRPQQITELRYTIYRYDWRLTMGAHCFCIVKPLFSPFAFSYSKSKWATNWFHHSQQHCHRRSSRTHTIKAPQINWIHAHVGRCVSQCAKIPLL